MERQLKHAISEQMPLTLTAIIKEMFPNPNSPLLVAGGDESFSMMWVSHRHQGS